MARLRRGGGALVAALASGAVLMSGCSGPAGARPLKASARLEEAWSGASPTPVGRYDAAKKLYQKRRYADAAVGFQRWLSLYPKNALEPAALYHLANAQFLAGMRSHAMATCERLAKDYPNTDWSKFAYQDIIAMKAAGESRAPKYHWWHPWDWFTPDPPLVREFAEARSLFLRRDFEKALGAFRTIAEQNPESPLAAASWYYAARSYEYVSQLDKARETYQHVTKTYPNTEWDYLAQDDIRRLKPD